eukprot:3593956-Lingulodinium_polyedra.AAC.1
MGHQRGPRCPTVVAQAAAAMASWTGGSWGPLPAQSRAREAAVAAEQAALRHVDDVDRATRDAARTVARLATDARRPGPVHAAGSGGDLYR